MAGQKISLKETSRGTKCVKQTNNINKGAWLFFPIGATHLGLGSYLVDEYDPPYYETFFCHVVSQVKVNKSKQANI